MTFDDLELWVPYQRGSVIILPCFKNENNNIIQFLKIYSDNDVFYSNGYSWDSLFTNFNKINFNHLNAKIIEYIFIRTPWKFNGT